MSGNPYRDKFGFLEEDVIALMQKSSSVQSLESVRSWYKPYLAGDDSEVYNPWSIVSLCRFGKLDSYWVETGRQI